MKKTLKKLAAISMAVCLICSLLTVAALAAAPSTVTYFADVDGHGQLSSDAAIEDAIVGPGFVFFGNVADEHTLIDNPFTLENGYI